MPIKTFIIHKEYRTHNNCTKCNNNTTEQFVIIIYISTVNINTADKFVQKNKI